MRVIDNLGVPEVVEFMQRKLEPFDTSKLWSIRLYSFNGVVHYNGMCYFPHTKRESGKRAHFRISAGVNLESLWPHTGIICNGTKDAEIRDPATNIVIQKPWIYTTKDVTFENTTEALVYVLGHEVFHFLRHSQQVPGRQSEPSANRYGLQWLEEWRQNGH